MVLVYRDPAPPAVGPPAVGLAQDLIGGRSGSLVDMERICIQCRVVLGKDTEADWCPACGGALIERTSLPVPGHPGASAAEVDHRGIVLPRRHAVGGIITPQ